MNFEAEYQLTFEEYKEAMTHIRKSVRKKQFPSTGPKRQAMGWILFIGLAVMLYFLEKQSGSPASAKKTPAPSSPINPLEMLLPLTPWLFIFGFIWFFIYRVMRGHHKRIWNQNPRIQRAQRITITGGGLTLTDVTSEHRYGWAHYERFEETPNLILLFITKNVAEVIPKRIFRNVSDVDQFRSLLERSISEQTGAFPVIPASGQNFGG